MTKVKYIEHYSSEYWITGCAVRPWSYQTQISIMEVIKETSCRSRFALFISSVDSRRNGNGRRCIEPSRLPVKQIKWVLRKRKLRKRIWNYVLKNVPKSSKVYQSIRAPFLRKTVVFANGERITEINEFRMTKKYPLRNRVVKCCHQGVKWCTRA